MASIAMTETTRNQPSIDAMDFGKYSWTSIKFWENGQGEKLEALRILNVLAFYQNFTLGQQPEKILNEFDKAKIQILLYLQLITIEPQLRRQGDVDFVKANLGTVGRSSRLTTYTVGGFHSAEREIMAFLSSCVGK
jgi:hypothetical protein